MAAVHVGHTWALNSSLYMFIINYIIIISSCMYHVFVIDDFQFASNLKFCFSFLDTHICLKNSRIVNKYLDQKNFSRFLFYLFN